MRITRRGTLLGLLALFGGTSGASILSCRPSGDATATLDPERLRVALADIIAPERIGRAYRAARDTSTLTAEFASKPGLVAAAAQECPATLRTQLQAQITEDFRRGDVVVADRFVVARSECILAALVA